MGRNELRGNSSVHAVTSETHANDAARAGARIASPGRAQTSGVDATAAGPATAGWPASGDWAGWAATWEARMRAFYPRRADGLAVILDLLPELLPPGPWRLLDLGAGTGTLSRALLDRYPDARVTALDLDPVLLAIGRGALGDGGGRLRWVQADLRDPAWIHRLAGHAAPPEQPSKVAAGQANAAPEPPFDAALTLATLHHFASREIATIYAQLAGLIRPSGLLVNAEDLADGRPGTRLMRCFEELRRRDTPPADGWWEAVQADPALAQAVAERERLRVRLRGAARRLSAAAHRRALRRAGFAEAAVAWRHLDEAVLIALR